MLFEHTKGRYSVGPPSSQFCQDFLPGAPSAEHEAMRKAQRKALDMWSERQKLDDEWRTRRAGVAAALGLGPDETDAAMIVSELEARVATLASRGCKLVLWTVAPDKPFGAAFGCKGARSELAAQRDAFLEIVQRHLPGLMTTLAAYQAATDERIEHIHAHGQTQQKLGYVKECVLPVVRRRDVAEMQHRLKLLGHPPDPCADGDLACSLACVHDDAQACILMAGKLQSKPAEAAAHWERACRIKIDLEAAREDAELLPCTVALGPFLDEPGSPAYAPERGLKLLDDICARAEQSEACSGGAARLLNPKARYVSADRVQRALLTLDRRCRHDPKSFACISLGEAYRTGVIGQVDREKAFELFSTACSASDERCAFVARLHEEGPMPDLAKARDAWERVCRSYQGKAPNAHACSRAQELRSSPGN